MLRKSASKLSEALLLLGLLTVPSMAPAADVKIIEGFGTTPESAVIGPDGKIYVSVVNKYEQYGDGYIGVVEGDKLVPLAKGLNDPHGLDMWKDALYTADNRGQIWKVGLDGTVTRVADATMFPRKISNFNDLEIDESNGDIYVSDSGDWEGRGGAIYRITQEGKVSTVLTDEEAWRLVSPNGLLFEDTDNLLVIDWTTGNLSRLNLKSKSFEKVNGGWGPGDGLARGPDGKLYVAAYYKAIYVLAKPDSEDRSQSIDFAGMGLKSAADITVSKDGKTLVIPDFDGSRIAIVSLQ